MSRTATGDAAAAWGDWLSGQVKSARDTKGLSRNQLSRLAGCSPNHIQRIESGLCASVGFLMLARLAEHLSLDLDDLYAHFSKREGDR